MILNLLLLFSALQAIPATAQSTNFSCYDDLPRCETAMRELVADEDKFWFGSSYTASCPDGAQASSGCGSADLDKKSILARLLNVSDDNVRNFQLNQRLSLLNITYNVPAGNYSGCGQTHQVPALTNVRVDPLGITRISSWSLRYTPSITWTPRSANVSYMLVFWDPGNFYLHGVYVNCLNGSLASGEVVRPYFGPLNAYLRANGYIFALYEQNATLNVSEVSQFLQGQDFIRPSIITDRFNVFTTNVPTHAGIMTIVADAHSVQKIVDWFSLMNNCPYLISQLDTFQNTVRVTNLSVPWSSATSTFSLERSTPFLTSLTVSINVRYDISDYSVESCCSDYSLTSGSIIVDPFKNTTLRPGSVQYKPLVQFSPVDLQNPNGILSDVYTLFLLDVADGLVPGAQNFTFVTHWLVTNIRNVDVNTGDEVARYFGPNPFFPNVPRAYMFLLLRQPVARLNNSIFSDFCPNGRMRCRINLKPVLQAWNLTDIVGVSWFLAEQDGFARYRLYSVLNVRTKAEVCNGLPGYADPCPTSPICPRSQGNGEARMVPTLELIAALFLFSVTKYYINRI